MPGFPHTTSSGQPPDAPRVPALSDLDNELKFVIDGRQAAVVHRWLASVCRPDPVFPTGTVLTIYYDTPEFDFLREKVNSDYLKTKVRLRWYENPLDADARSFLEGKFRIGTRRTKVRAETPYAGAWLARTPLNDQALRQIPAALRASGILVPSSLRPVLLVRYTRRRFVDPISGTRISLDTSISVPRVNLEVLPVPNPLPLSVAIVEVKGPVTGLPAVLRHLHRMGGRRVSFSKYLACYAHVLPGAG